MFGKSPSLKIVLDEHLFFLRSKPSRAGGTIEDPVVQGSLSLSLAKSKGIKRLTVRIMCDHAVYSGPRAFRQEKGESTIAQVAVKEFSRERSFPKGEHKFRFALSVPSVTEPFQLCSYGGTSHSIVAVLEGGKTARSHIKTSAPIFFLANPAPIGETRYYNMHVQNCDEEVGPFSVSAVSEHLTIGGLVSFGFKLGNVPTTINILSVSAHLETTYRTMSIEEPTKQIGQGSQRTLLVEIDRSKTITPDTFMLTMGASGVLPAYLTALSGNDILASPDHIEQGVPFQVVPTGGSFQLSHLARLPPGKVIRPSTPLGSNSLVQISHELVLALMFTTVPPGTVSEADIYAPARSLTARGKVIITSCCCMIASLMAPKYVETPSAEDSGGASSGTPISQLLEIEPSWDCVCACSTVHLLEHVEAVTTRLRQELAGIHGDASLRQETEDISTMRAGNMFAYGTIA